MLQLLAEVYKNPANYPIITGYRMTGYGKERTKDPGEKEPILVQLNIINIKDK